MGRKKRRAESSRIFCYYCDRDFSTEHELVNHQKEKHLRCPTCHKRMVSTTGLVVHALQVHKRTITAVPNAVEGRDDPKVDVYGMQGVPSEESMDKQASKRRNKNPGLTVVADGFEQANSSVSPVIDIPPPVVNVQYPLYDVSQLQNPTSAIPSQPILSPYPHSETVVRYPGPYQDPAIHPAGNRYGSMSSAPRFPAQAPGATRPWVSGNPRHHHSVPLHDRPVINPMPNGPVYSGRPIASFPSRAATIRVAPSNLPSSSPHISASLVGGQGAASNATSNTPKPYVKPVTIVFSRDDVCMEELRAELPRYKHASAGTFVPVLDTNALSNRASCSSVSPGGLDSSETAIFKGE
jgi:hypothetical protein